MKLMHNSLRRLQPRLQMGSFSENEPIFGVCSHSFARYWMAKYRQLRRAIELREPYTERLCHLEL